jgi:hypothetical protein
MSVYIVSIIAEDLYQDYKQKMPAPLGRKQLSKKDFGRKVKKLKGQGVRHKQARYNDKRYWIYTGITTRERKEKCESTFVTCDLGKFGTLSPIPEDDKESSI